MRFAVAECLDQPDKLKDLSEKDFRMVILGGLIVPASVLVVIAIISGP